MFSRRFIQVNPHPSFIRFGVRSLLIEPFKNRVVKLQFLVSGLSKPMKLKLLGWTRIGRIELIIKTIVDKLFFLLILMTFQGKLGASFFFFVVALVHNRLSLFFMVIPPKSLSCSSLTHRPNYLFGFFS